MRGRVAVVLATVNAALLVLVGGCTAGPPVPEQTFAEYTPTSTPTPTVAAVPDVPVDPPVRPAEMERSDQAGAEAAAAYFLELFSYVMRTGDLQEWDHISAQDCRYCAATRERVAATYQAGGRFVGGELTLTEVEWLTYTEAIGVHAVGTRYSFASGAEVNSAGTAVREMPPEGAYAVTDLVFSANGWTLLGVSIDEGKAS